MDDPKHNAKRVLEHLDRAIELARRQRDQARALIVRLRQLQNEGNHTGPTIH